MDWATIAQLILQIGLPAVQALIKKWENKDNVTSAQLDELIALASRSARDRMTAALVAQGIDPASPQGQILLAAVS
jgi:hypothetical protein